MNLTVLTPEKELFSGQISSVNVPGIKGQFEILKGHAPIVSALGTGKVKITDAAGTKTEIEIAKGFIEVLRNEVSVLVTLTSINKH
jgi:F-type H+-transporting ATPase subunit epsilon